MSKKARLIRDGVPFLGMITERYSRALGLGSQQPARQPAYRLICTFTDAEGAERTGKSVWLPRGLVPRWPVNELRRNVSASRFFKVANPRHTRTSA